MTDSHPLVQLARESIESYVCHEEQINTPTELPSELQQPAGAFVTIRRQGQLRGCIGTIQPTYDSVAEEVIHNAISAATRDPRFPPVRPGELDDLHVEISVLSIPQPLSYDGPDDLIAKLRPGVDGVVIERGWNRATFLPQVWEKLPDPHQFLEHLCSKAYLPAGAYRSPGLDVYTYQVEKFEEG